MRGGLRLLRVRRVRGRPVLLGGGRSVRGDSRLLRDPWPSPHLRRRHLYRGVTAEPRERARSRLAQTGTRACPQAGGALACHPRPGAAPRQRTGGSPAGQAAGPPTRHARGSHESRGSRERRRSACASRFFGWPRSRATRGARRSGGDDPPDAAGRYRAGGRSTLGSSSPRRSRRRLRRRPRFRSGPPRGRDCSEIGAGGREIATAA